MDYANYTHVTLVVDPRFGDRAKAQTEIGPLWVIESPENGAAIKALWAGRHLPCMNAPTIFHTIPGRSSEEAAALNIGTVDEHHPNWQTFEVIGVPLSQALLNAFHEFTSGTAQDTAEGFVFTRTN